MLDLGSTRVGIVAGVLVSISLCAEARTLTDVVRGNRQSVVYVRVQKANDITGAVSEHHGTGFIVNKDGFVITSAHVVSGGIGLQVDVRGATGSREGSLEGMEVVYESSSLDIAVLRFKNTAISRQAVVLGDPWKVSDDATVYAMGFPGVEEWFHAEGRLSGKGPRGSWNTTVVLNPGMSGGPIFDTEGNVIAVAWGGVPTQGVNGINRVLPVNLLVEPLRIVGRAITALAPARADPADRSGVEQVAYRVDQTQNTLGGLQAATRPYTHTFAARPGYKIVDVRFISRSANNATQPTVAVSEDKQSLSVSYSLTSGPVFDQWRGWLDAEVLTRQVKSGSGE